MVEVFSPVGLLSSAWLFGQVVTTLGVVSLLFTLVRHRIKQMVLRQILGPPSASMLIGNYMQMFNPISGTEFLDHVRRTYGAVCRINAPLGDQSLFISDPAALSNMICKNQDIFEETEWFIEVFRHCLGPGLLSTTGVLHRKQRKSLNPLFATKHLRTLVPLFHKITRQLQDAMQASISAGPQEVDILYWLGPLALELIAQGGLGHTFDSFKPGSRDTGYETALKEFAPAMARLLMFRSIFPLVSRWPSRILRIGAACLPLPNVHYVMRLVEIMHQNTKRIFDAKKAMLAKGDSNVSNEVGEGKDIISVLMRANLNATEDNKMQDDEIMAQMTTFLAAGTDTTSTALSRVLYLLAQHQSAQERLREEIMDAVAIAGDELAYDDLVALPYLDAVCRETLRLFPPVGFVVRVCREDTTVPLSQPIQTSRGPLSTLFVPRNTTVFLDIIGVNQDASIWGVDAREWKPERWLSPLPESVAFARIAGVYSNTLTFLGGARACIGFKFSELEMKVALSQLIRSFRFSPSKTEVIWRLGAIITPSVKGSDAVSPKLPVILERISIPLDRRESCTSL
ncbi:cytochrome P450 [Artomyces pyxidatus]|uniref:Cytochrome P450 n=1 Tax=Artomyces pyxidatus TaxID=48021 RepID=A0ACB8SMA5_9AGAM|nr:cytochrome P450 [Artomyces pyxidatus]